MILKMKRTCILLAAILIPFAFLLLCVCGQMRKSEGKTTQVENKDLYFQLLGSYSNEISKLESIAVKYDAIITNTAAFYWENISLQQYFRKNDSILDACVFDPESRSVNLPAFKSSWQSLYATEPVFSMRRVSLSKGIAIVNSRSEEVIILVNTISQENSAKPICFRLVVLSPIETRWEPENGFDSEGKAEEHFPTNIILKSTMDASIADVTSGLAPSVKKWRGTMETEVALLFENPITAATEKNSAANELFSLLELPDGVVGDLAQMFASADEDEVWRDYCLQFLGSALEREDGVTDADRARARETLVKALASTNATFAGTALRALHRGDPSDPLVASNALRIARDPAFPSASRTTALLVLEECIRTTSSTLQPFNPSTLADTAAAVSADSTASPLLRQAAEAVLKRVGSKTTND